NTHLDGHIIRSCTHRFVEVSQRFRSKNNKLTVLPGFGFGDRIIPDRTIWSRADYHIFLIIQFDRIRRCPRFWSRRKR
ncbi:MAG: hypothetical protein BJ554DRAFT_6087, partial [Olpidium bornovanus]